MNRILAVDLGPVKNLRPRPHKWVHVFYGRHNTLALSGETTPIHDFANGVLKPADRASSVSTTIRAAYAAAAGRIACCHANPAAEWRPMRQSSHRQARYGLAERLL